MEFCTSCGTKLADGASRCVGCGVEVSAPDAASEPAFLQPDQQDLSGGSDPSAGQNPYEGAGPYAPAPQKNGIAIAAMVLGIIGLVLFVTVVFGIILGLLAVIFGFIGRGRAKATPQNTNAGKALAGIILGFLALGASTLWLVTIWDEFSYVLQVQDVQMQILACDDEGIIAEVRWADDGTVDVTLEAQAIAQGGNIVWSEEVTVFDLSNEPQTLTIDFPEDIDTSFNQCFLVPLAVD